LPVTLVHASDEGINAAVLAERFCCQLDHAIPCRNTIGLTTESEVEIGDVLLGEISEVAT
jgi:hypothetical protein